MFVEVISCQHDEQFLKPFFNKHYSWVDKITIIDKEMPNGIDDELRKGWINESYRSSTADWVIIVDADEFVFVNPRHLNLIHADITVKKVMLYDVYKHITEKDLNPEIPVNEQRRHGVLNTPFYIKPIVLRGGQNIEMGIGNHGLGGQCKIDMHCFVGAHWKNADLQFAIDTRINKRGKRMSELNKEKGWGLKDCCVTEEEIRAEHEYHSRDPIVF